MSYIIYDNSFHRNSIFHIISVIFFIFLFIRIITKKTHFHENYLD